MQFLPTTLDECKAYYKSDSFDIIIVTGDPYYDHPLSGSSILLRLLDAKGYKVGIIAQPETDAEFEVCGKPNYCFCVTSGLLDSVLANNTPLLKPRENVLVPERALIKYTQTLKRLYKSPVLLGGVEATIRRFTHFDYKDNKLRNPVLVDAKADMLLFGSAERSLLQILELFKQGQSIESIKSHSVTSPIEGVCIRIKESQLPQGVKILPTHEECVADPDTFNVLSKTVYLWPNMPFIQKVGLSYLYHTHLPYTFTEQEIDYIYELPTNRALHPKSKNFKFNQEMVEMLHTSVIIGRGCWGSCSFCVIPLVQGKEIAKRSAHSIVKEIKALYENGLHKINDLTLPTLNMYGSRCELYNVKKTIHSPIIESDVTVYDKTQFCNQHCAGCEHRVLSDDLIEVLTEVKKLQGTITGTELELRSAVRHDIILEQEDLFREIMKFTKRLKIAPEHVANTVLKQMNKSTQEAFTQFLTLYEQVNEEQKTHKNLTPYFVAAHPGCTMQDMKDLKQYCNEHKIYVNLTQIYTPTPGTLSTSMYYTSKHPITHELIHIPRTFREKKDQKNVMFEQEEFVDDNG